MADQNQNPKPAPFPKAVYKRGTGKKGQGDDAAVSAESRIVNSEEELKSLGGDWVNTPQEALSGATARKGADASAEEDERKGTSKR